ncbi:Alpha/Beta hydrolase protein [Bisporella sp. PMI_857]|nr:Alpha/Beta hydrolase protein [Bisporella sp. PMI_857]
MSVTKLSNITVDGVDVFYRAAGNPSLPTLLLLHGFPSSSHQYRNLIPILSKSYHVVAPDFPGFGFTTVPEDRHYQYTFANLAQTTAAFIDALRISKFTVYIFDYGAPVALRLALDRPDAITGIITQNGNAYAEGLGGFWDQIKVYWASNSTEDRENLRKTLLTLAATKWQYENGNPAFENVPPETYHLDYALMERPGNKDIQLDLFKNYETNLPLYPKFQEYFRTSNVPILAVWGSADQIFIPAGATAFKKDSKTAEVHLLDAPHFALEGREQVFADLILEFLKRHGI